MRRTQTFDADARDARFDRISWHMLGRVSESNGAQFAYVRRQLEREKVYAQPPFADVLEFYLWHKMFESFYTAHMSDTFLKKLDRSLAVLALARDRAALGTPGADEPTARGCFLVQNYAAHGARLYYAAGYAGMGVDALGFLDYYAARVDAQEYALDGTRTLGDAHASTPAPAYMLRYWAAYLRGLYECGHEARARIAGILAAQRRAEPRRLLFLMHDVLRAVLEADDVDFLRSVLVPAADVRVPVALLFNDVLDAENGDLSGFEQHYARQMCIGGLCVRYLITTTDSDTAHAAMYGIIGRFLDDENAADFTMALLSIATHTLVVREIVDGLTRRPLTVPISALVASWSRFLRSILTTSGRLRLCAWAAHSFCRPLIETYYRDPDELLGLGKSLYAWMPWTRRDMGPITIAGDQLIRALHDRDFRLFHLRDPFPPGARITATVTQWQTISAAVAAIRVPVRDKDRNTPNAHAEHVAHLRANFFVCALTFIPPGETFDPVAELLLEYTEDALGDILPVQFDPLILRSLFRRDSQRLFFRYVIGNNVDYYLNTLKTGTRNFSAPFSPLIDRIDFERCIWAYMTMINDDRNDIDQLLIALVDIIAILADGKLYKYMSNIGIQRFDAAVTLADVANSLGEARFRYTDFNTAASRELWDKSSDLLETLTPPDETQNQ